MIFDPQPRHPDLPDRQYDFLIKYNDQNIYVEYDGGPHFFYVEYFHKTQEVYEERRYIDILKTQTVINSNDRIIRIDHTLKESEVEEHILRGINSTAPCYFSNPTLYEWIIAELHYPSNTVHSESSEMTLQRSMTNPIQSTSSSYSESSPMAPPHPIHIKAPRPVYVESQLIPQRFTNPIQPTIHSESSQMTLQRFTNPIQIPMPKKAPQLKIITNPLSEVPTTK